MTLSASWVFRVLDLADREHGARRGLRPRGTRASEILLPLLLCTHGTQRGSCEIRSRGSVDATGYGSAVIFAAMRGPCGDSFRIVASINSLPGTQRNLDSIMAAALDWPACCSACRRSSSARRAFPR